jgi:3',5'-cyclic AMP phosphodiesterase CpdA
MGHRTSAILLALTTLALATTPALSAPRTTVERTIIDREADDPAAGDHNLLDPGPGEDYTVFGDDQDFRPSRQGSILNFLQLSDFQIVDEESPGRVEFLDTTQRPPINPFSAAYRPQEALTTQITEAMVRQARNTTSPITGEQLDLSILTGDNADSQQFNETRWFIDILDGTVGSPTKVDPDSGVVAPCPGGQTPPDDGPYDGVKGGGDPGYYDPDASAGSDGQGYSPRQDENRVEVQRDVRVRDFPGLLEEAQKPFEAVGLGMPWYSAFGNHDALVQGNSPDAYFGPGGVFPPNQETNDPAYDAVVRGCLKPSKLPPNVTPEQFVDDPVGNLAGSQPLLVPRDDRRCYLAKDNPILIGAEEPCERGWIGEHFETTGTPAGHGFSNRPPTAEENQDGYYSFNPREGLRFVVLDTVTDECGSIFCSNGSVDDPQFQWLDQEIKDAAGKGEYVLVFSHHTLETTNQPSTDTTEGTMHYGQRDGSPPGGTTLEELFCSHPNVIALVDGHEHANDVEQRTCPEDPGVPEPPAQASFWEVTTAAHIDWPQQSRMIELVQNDDEDRTVSLVLTILDHDGPAHPGAPTSEAGGQGDSGSSVLRLASIGRELAFNDYQHGRSARGDPEDRNVIIKTGRPWPYPPDEPEETPGG